MDLKAGDVVVLKSGGVAMTVIDTWYNRAGSIALCVWMKDAEVHKTEFAEACLDKLNEKEEAPSTKDECPF